MVESGWPVVLPGQPLSIPVSPSERKDWKGHVYSVIQYGLRKRASRSRKGGCSRPVSLVLVDFFGTFTDQFVVGVIFSLGEGTEFVFTKFLLFEDVLYWYAAL